MVQQYLDCCGPVIVVKRPIVAVTSTVVEFIVVDIIAYLDGVSDGSGGEDQHGQSGEHGGADRHGVWRASGGANRSSAGVAALIYRGRPSHLPPAYRHPPAISPAPDNACKLTPPRYLQLPVYSRNWHWINNHQDKP